MRYYFDRLPFPADSRLTGIWAGRRVTQALEGVVVTGHLIRLPGYQDGEIESDFLSSHLHLSAGGFHGLYPDGTPWVFLIQIAPEGLGSLVGIDDPHWAPRDSLQRALRFNHEAEVVDEDLLDRERLLAVYAWAGVGPDDVALWPVSDLVKGLMAECCYVDLDDVVAGYAAGCAFPGVEHDCQADVFSDVFAAWAQGRLADLVPQAEDDDDDEWVTLAEIRRWPRAELEAIAHEYGVRTRKRSGKKRSRARILADMAEVTEDDE
ncbi:MAG: hypothetical protein Q7V58_00610 [Actinomycetota bacterium]|nr:hypothetical protein [Actinomycetota bacterium]